MVSAPEIVWFIFNALGVMGSLIGAKNRGVGFGLTLGTSALSCALLFSGAINLFLGAEIIRWLIFTIIVLLGAAAEATGNDISAGIERLAVSSGVRFTLALIVWLWI